VLIFFIAGLLYLLRFERLDNLGAYSIPPETGSSHPIWLHQLSSFFLENSCLFTGPGLPERTHSSHKAA